MGVCVSVSLCDAAAAAAAAADDDEDDDDDNVTGDDEDDDHDDDANDAAASAMPGVVCQFCELFYPPPQKRPPQRATPQFPPSPPPPPPPRPPPPTLPPPTTTPLLTLHPAPGHFTLACKLEHAFALPVAVLRAEALSPSTALEIRDSGSCRRCCQLAAVVVEVF